LNYRLIAIDIDGTLLNDQYEIPERTVEAINQAMDHCHLVLCTGRALFSTKPLLEHFHRPLPLVTDNGGTIWFPDRGIVEQYTLSRSVAEELLLFSRRHRLHIDFTTGDGIYVERLDDALEAVYRKYFAVPKQLDDLLQLEQLPVKVTISGRPDQIDQAYPAVQEQFTGKVQFFRSGPHFIDFIAFGVNKGTALQKLASELGVAREQTMAIGNYYNDLEMIRMSGLGVAVANAPEEVKRQADLVTDSNNEEGVRKILETFVLASMKKGESGQHARSAQ